MAQTVTRVWTVVYTNSEDPAAGTRAEYTDVDQLPLLPEVLAALRSSFLSPEFFEFKMASMTQTLHITCADYPHEAPGA